MANAIKNVAKYIKNNPGTDESVCLAEFCTALEGGSEFDVQRIFGLKSKAFELALEVMADWRFDRHVAERRLQKFLESSED
jgi:hypothetical protein